MRRRPWSWYAAVAAAGLSIPLVAGTWRTDPTLPGPRTLAEAAAIAETLGLYHTSPEPAGVVMERQMAVSERPLTPEQCSRLVVNHPTHPGWRGTVALYTPWEALMDNYDPACSAVWGEVFVYGDPALIRKLTDATR